MFNFFQLIEKNFPRVVFQNYSKARKACLYYMYVDCEPKKQ